MVAYLSRRTALAGLLAWPIAARGQSVAVFPSRLGFVSAVAAGRAFAPGAFIEAGGYLYTQGPGPAIPDLPGWTGLARSGALLPEHYGALGDGLQDDRPALQAALDAGAALHGWGKTYGVSGTLHLRGGARLENLTLKQLTPGPETVTLRAQNVSGVTLRRVSVDRNGTGQNGGATRDETRNWSINLAYGVWIDGGEGHLLDRLEVYGDDSGTGLRLDRLTAGSRIIAPYVHDIFCARDRIDDDVTQGIWLNRCQGLELTCRVHDLTTLDRRGQITARATRGIAVTGSRDVVVRGCQLARVGQAIDFTGSEGNFACQAIGNRIDRAYSVGVKFANSAVGCTARGNWVYRPGRNAIIVSGPSEAGLPHLTEDTLVEDNTGIDVGYGGNFPGRSQGIIVERQPLHHNHPRGTRLVNNRMIDTQEVPTMEYGAFCDAELQPGDARNTNCGLVSVGHIKGAQTGFTPGC